MFGRADLIHELNRIRKNTRRGDETLVSEAKKILKQDLFAEKKILEHLTLYKSSFEVPDEEDLDASMIYTLSEIRQLSVIYRLKFLDSTLFKQVIPQEVDLKIRQLNARYHKDIRAFRVLAPGKSFGTAGREEAAMVFVKTNYENYLLLHAWGRPLKQARKLLVLPLRRFETLIVTVVLVTLVIALTLPTRLITLDHTATYWSGYRAAAFFHLLIFNAGVTVYFTFAFAKNFSSTVWNRYKDF